MPEAGDGQIVATPPGRRQTGNDCRPALFPEWAKAAAENAAWAVYKFCPPCRSRIEPWWIRRHIRANIRLINRRPNTAQTAARSVLVERQRLQNTTHYFCDVDTVTPYQANALTDRVADGLFGNPDISTRLLETSVLPVIRP